MSVILKGIFGLGILDIEKADDIVLDCDIEISLFRLFLERKIAERNIGSTNMDIIGLLYEYILEEAKSEVYDFTDEKLPKSIIVSANSLATSYDYRPLDYDEIQRILRSTFEYQMSPLLQFFVEKFL